MAEPNYKQLRQIQAQNIDLHNKLNQIIDVRNKDLDKRLDQLYLQSEQFKAQMQAEYRREIEMSFDLAVRSLPFWNRGVKAVTARAEELKTAVKARYDAELAKLMKEAEEKQKADEEAKALEAKLVKDAELLKKAEEARKKVEDFQDTMNIEADGMQHHEMVDESMNLVDDGFGGKKVATAVNE